MSNTLVVNKLKSRHLQLDESGCVHNLTFSSQELPGNKWIGLDGRNRKLIIIERDDFPNRSSQVDLEEVTSLSVKKVYQNIHNGELKHRKIDDFLESIALILELNNGQDQIVLPFYDRDFNDPHEIAPMESKAKKWREMLSKITATNEIRA